MKDIRSKEELLEITEYMQKEVNDIPKGSHYSADFESLMTKIADKLDFNIDEKLAFGIGVQLGAMFDKTPEWLRDIVKTDRQGNKKN